MPPGKMASTTQETAAVVSITKLSAGMLVERTKVAFAEMTKMVFPEIMATVGTHVVFAMMTGSMEAPKVPVVAAVM